MTGLRSVDPNLLELARSVDASKRDDLLAAAAAVGAALPVLRSPDRRRPGPDRRGARRVLRRRSEGLGYAIKIAQTRPILLCSCGAASSCSPASAPSPPCSSARRALRAALAQLAAPLTVHHRPSIHHPHQHHPTNTNEQGETPCQREQSASIARSSHLGDVPPRLSAAALATRPGRRGVLERRRRRRHDRRVGGNDRGARTHRPTRRPAPRRARTHRPALEAPTRHRRRGDRAGIGRPRALRGERGGRHDHLPVAASTSPPRRRSSTSWSPRRGLLRRPVPRRRAAAELLDGELPARRRRTRRSSPRPATTPRSSTTRATAPSSSRSSTTARRRSRRCSPPRAAPPTSPT